MARTESQKAPIWIWLSLWCAFGGLQYLLWFGSESVRAGLEMQALIESQKVENQQLFQRNKIHIDDLVEIKGGGMDSVEERARHSLGMVKKGETMYVIAE